MFLLFGVIFKIAVVNGESMYPTLHSGAVVIFNSLFYRNPEQGDIISFKENGQNYIKRVIGTEGDIVDIDFESGTVFVNGIALEEKYVNEATYTSYDKKFPITVDKNTVFVLGDNRNHSLDSRSSEIGLVKKAPRLQ